MPEHLASRGGHSLAAAAYEQIKGDICSGRYRQGQLLSESLLATELGMSRTPVREALRALAAEDLVEVRNGIGVVVKTISPQDMLDLFQLRLALEPLAARTALDNISQEEIDRMEQGFLELQAAYGRGEPLTAADFSTLDWELHDLLVNRSRNRYVVAMANSIYAHIRRYQSYAYTSLFGLAESTQQHLAILDRLRARDGAGLEEVLIQHLQWSAHFWRESL